jgi:hypothetical protein
LNINKNKKKKAVELIGAGIKSRSRAAREIAREK